MAYSKYGLSFKNFTDSYGEWEANGGVEQANKAIDFKNLQNNSFNVRGLPGGTFGQSVIDSTLGVAGNIDDFFGGPTGLGDYANNYVTAQEMAMGEKPKADFSWDYFINGLPRDTGNLVGSGIGLAVPTAAAALAAPFVGTAGAATAAVGGALAAAGLESMAEGGQKMRDSLANGDSLETAQDKARTVAGENMALLAPTNLLGLGALKKVGQGIKNAYKGGKMATAADGALANYPKLSQAADFAKGAGWAGLGAMNEGAQEAWQQGIQDSVEPDTDWGVLPWNWNDEQAEAFKSTIGPTALMAGVGGGARLAARKLGASDVQQVDTAPQANNNLFGAGTAEIATQGADIDEQVAHLKDGYQSVIPQVAGVLVNDFGIEGAQISSGFRTREHNKEVGGAENSYHVGDGEHGDALDIVLPDGISAETAEAIKQRFENSGVFDEVLFHDAGSGYHLHLGGLKTDNIGNSYGSYSGNADVDSAINEMAEKYNLDPALLAAMAEQESGFNQSAQSEAGAMGIMQLMPGTAEGLGVDPSDLRGNLEGGAKYLRQLLDKYDGDVEKALAAYNAGSGSLDSVNGDISKLSGETQKYVPSVMERYNKFKNKVGGGISSSGNILDWDSTNEDFSKLDFFPKDGEQSQGTANEFLENLAKLEESDDQATKEKGRQAQDILQQYGDDTEKLTEKAKELGYQQTVDPAEVHGRIPMRRIVSTALDKGQVTFATKKAADIFASSPIGQTMERQGKTFKVTDNFKMNEQVNAISQQVNAQKQPATKTVQNTVKPDVAVPVPTPLKPEKGTINNDFAINLLNTLMNIPEAMISKTGTRINPDAVRRYIQNNDLPAMNKVISAMYKNVQEHGEKNKNVFKDVYRESATATLETLLNTPEALTSTNGARIVPDKVREYMQNGNIPLMTQAINAMSQNLREHGIEPQFSTRVNDNQLNSKESVVKDYLTTDVTEDSSHARQPEYNGEESHEEDVKKEESTKGQTKSQSNGNENPNASNEPMRKELIEQAAANEDTWVNSKKSELHLEDDNDTVVKLTPQELKYYQDLIKKGVVAKSELYEESQEDVGEMDDNVEMSKEQKQLYDESSDDRDMPSVEDEAEPTAGEPRTKYSREKSPVDEKKPTHHNVECRDAKEQAKRYVQSRLDNGALKTLKPSDDVNTAIEKIIAPIKREVDNQAARYLEAGHEPEYYQARLNMINYYKQLVDEIRRDFNAGDRQSDVYGRVINDTWFKQSAGEGSNLRKSVQKRNAEIETREDENSGVNSSSAKTGKTYENYNPKTQKVLDMMYKHSSRDKSAFSIEPINPHSAESLKENGNSNTELDRLPKVPIAKLRQSEQKIVRFGKAIGVPVHFVESSDTTNRGVFTHNGEIFINRKAKVPAHSIFVHEFVHWLKASPENAGAYDVLHACLENSSGLFNEARINKYRGKIFDGGKMTDEEIVEEIICDAMTHTESAEKLMRAVNNVDGDLATRVAGYLKAMWDKFCKAIGFNPKILSRKQQLPNALSVEELQKADIAFNKILMNIKGNDGKPVFYRKGTDLVLRDTDVKPVEAYQINPISYTYAFASADNNPDRISPREQDSQYMSAVEAYQNESDPAKKESMLDKIRGMVQQAAKTAGFENAIPEQTRAYTVRTKPAPKKTMKVYKVFTVDDKGRPSALFVSSKDILPQNVWLDANDTFAFTDNNNGRKYIPSTKNPNSKGGATGGSRKTENISAEELAKLEELGYIKRNKQGQYPKTITALAYRPGWHAGDLPFFPQGGKQGDGTTNYKNIHRYNQVVFECEIAYDKDYTNSTINKKGQIVYSDRQEMPTDGGYKFATNPMTSQNDLGNWYISGSLKIGRALTEEECNKILAKNGFKPQEWQAYGSGNDFVLGKLDLEKLGYTGEEFDAARKTLAPITYDDNGNVIPLSQRFNPNVNDVRYSRGFNLKKNPHNPQKQHNSSVLLDSEDGTYKTIQINYLFYEPQPNESQEYRVARRKAELFRFDTDSLFHQGDSIDSLIPKANKEAFENELKNDALSVIIRLKEAEWDLANNPLVDRETEEKRISKLFVLRGGIDYVERLIRESNGTTTQLRARGFQSIFGLDVSNSRVPLGRFRQRYEKEIADNPDNIIKISDKHSEQGAFSIGNKYSRGVDLSPSTDGVAIAARANNNLLANMKGLAKKANAKFNPFHHEELENLRIDKRDKEKDLNLIEYQFVSPTRESKKYKVIHPFVMKGKQAIAKQEKLRFEFNEGMNELDKLLGWREGFHRNDPKFKERKEALNEILLKGDLERKEFTNEELIKAGYDAETIKGYHKMRALLDKAWKLADETKSRIKYQSITSSTQRRAEADFADLKDKNPFAEIISKVHNPDGTVTINYKSPHVRRVDKQTVLPSELENLRKNKDVHIVETTQSLKGTTQVTYYQREAGMGKLKGYIPHIFHGWYVCKVDKDGKAIIDDDGNVALDNIMTTANSLSEAAKLGRKFAKANPNGNYRIIPQMFGAPGAHEQAIIMGDFDYAKIVGQVADSMSMSISDAQAMLDNTVKMKNRGRFYGYAKQRKGFKGFEQNVYLATMKYFNQTARYAAMDSFKRDSISMYNRIFGAFDDENVTKRSAMAKWTKQYIYDVNGTPTWIEKMINNTLHNFGLGEERAGGRPALWLQQKIFTYPMTILKLGVFNPSSALLNLTQLFNLYGAMGEKVLSPQAYQRLLHKGFADTFRAMNNKDSELGKLLWKDLGLDYQIGMDVASGYSNAEVNNLASLRGFAGRLAGKSMYLFRQSDAFARGVTLLTAYNKALDEGKSKAEAIEYAKEINDKVNFDYSVADEPAIFRAFGPISKVLLQFKKYPVKQLELFQDFYLDGRELGLNRKQAALRTLKYMAPYMAMSGMMGIPFISLAGGLLSALVATATGDDDWDWEKKIKQYMITEFGEDSPITQWWLYGAGSFIGLNLGGRVGVGDFLGSDSYNSADGLLGLAVNQTTLGSTVQQVSKQLSYRNYAEALKAINPTMGNIALAYKGEVRTTRGRMKYQYQNMAERMWRAIGFTPLNETLAGDLASNEYAEKQEQTKAKQEAVDDFLANPSSENAERLNELGVTPKTLENESARRTMNRHQLNELAKEKEAAKKKKKPNTYSASDYLKAVQ